MQRHQWINNLNYNWQKNFSKVYIHYRDELIHLCTEIDLSFSHLVWPDNLIQVWPDILNNLAKLNDEKKCVLRAFLKDKNLEIVEMEKVYNSAATPGIPKGVETASLEAASGSKLPVENKTDPCGEMD